MTKQNTRTARNQRAPYIVYCPEVGYDLKNDTGKRFTLPAAADFFCMRLRNLGHLAWVETDLMRAVDEYGM